MRLLTLSTQAVHERTGYALSTIAGACASGELRAAKFGGAWHIAADDIDRWVGTLSKRPHTRGPRAEPVDQVEVAEIEAAPIDERLAAAEPRDTVTRAQLETILRIATRAERRALAAEQRLDSLVSALRALDPKQAPLFDGGRWRDDAEPPHV